MEYLNGEMFSWFCQWRWQNLSKLKADTRITNFKQEFVPKMKLETSEFWGKKNKNHSYSNSIFISTQCLNMKLISFKIKNKIFRKTQIKCVCFFNQAFWIDLFQVFGFWFFILLRKPNRFHFRGIHNDPTQAKIFGLDQRN